MLNFTDLFNAEKLLRIEKFGRSYSVKGTQCDRIVNQL
jgi:hypothetical protein